MDHSIGRNTAVIVVVVVVVVINRIRDWASRSSGRGRGSRYNNVCSLFVEIYVI